MIVSFNSKVSAFRNRSWQLCAAELLKSPSAKNAKRNLLKKWWLNQAQIVCKSEWVLIKGLFLWEFDTLHNNFAI